MNRWMLAGVLVALFCVIYIPDAGHGFVKDDFQWISDARQLLSGSVSYTGGFYRPLVAATFRADYELFGLHSYPYGLTNLALALACAVLVWWLARTLGLGVQASIFGAAVWAFNFHGINMGVLWISGRTALLLTLFALLAATAFVRGHKLLCLLCISAALLSKEEAVLLPLALMAWSAILRRNIAWWLLLPLPIYAVLRLQTDAITPANAPEFYQFTFAPLSLGRNLLEYLDRSCTFAVIALGLLWCVARPPLSVATRRRRAVLCGAAWFVFGIGVTLFLPVRSNLYACGPSVGAAIAAAAIADEWFARMAARQVRIAVIAGVVILAVLVPVYRVRNQRWVELADLSSDTMAAIRRCADARCSSILLEDDPNTRRNFKNAFGTFGTATSLFLGREISTAVVDAAPAAGAQATDGGCVLHVRLIADIPDAQLLGCYDDPTRP